MLFLIVVAVIMGTVAVVFLLPDPDPQAAPDAGSAPAEPAGPAPLSLEGTLVAGLLGGEFSREQYRGAVARLAAREEERNPMALPGPDATT
ncbi:hypothetical protein SAMN05421541_119144 [Actinoplanes philippinensis]|uniref:Uncharacterized protein n=2 Tax=Actinoplanes philippinensis TaxID=35752 RepID=A0A1I2L146_9ACTN|nr:hypothetical protein SAMN05421541_119144 [Actinoplanes philippinensis]